MSKKRPLKDVADPGPYNYYKHRRGQDQTSEDDNQALFSDSGFSESQDSQPMSMEVDMSPFATEPSYMYNDDSDLQSEDNYFSKELPFTQMDENNNELSPNSSEKNGVNNRCSFAENVLYCTIALGSDAAKKLKEEKRRRMQEGPDVKEEETGPECVLKQCCALLNSGGGVLEMTIADHYLLATDPSALDKFWQKIEQKLGDMIKPSKYDDVFDRCEQPNSDKILLFISAPQHLCTLEYNLFLPMDSSVEDASYQDAVDFLAKETKQGRRRKPLNVAVAIKDLPKVPTKFTHQEVQSTLKESKQIQLKHFTSKTVLDTGKQCDKISRQMSAFANAGGGVILLGVEDNGKVSGIDVAKNSREDIERRVQDIVNKMCWGFIPERGVHWNIKFFQVLGCESKAIVVIHVAGIHAESSGGVFGKCPKSFELRQSDGQVIIRRLEFNEWKQRMLSGEKLRSDSKAMEAMFSRFEEFSVSTRHLMTVKGDVQRIRDSFFIAKEDFPVFPEGFEDNLPKEAQVIIRKIRKRCTRDCNRGLLVASRSWLGNTGGTPMEGVFCDLLLISRDMGGLHLYTICQSATDERFLRYSKETAQSIKKSLVRDGGCTKKFYVSYHVISCSEPKEIELVSRDDRYPKGYDLGSFRKKLNEVLKAMVIILASVPSTLSNKLGVSIMKLLTKQQFQLLQEQIEIHRELWVKGVAGTGKTLVAVEFMRKLLHRENLNKTEILCVCENEGIANQIRESNVCTVVCRQTFMLIEFHDVQHVVMDEVHNYEQPPGTESWFEKARRLVRQHDHTRPGYLWFFTDKCQSNHTFRSGIPEKQEPHFSLTKVIRNSQQIFNHSKQYIPEQNLRDILEIGHDFEGEGVEGIPYSNSETSQLDVVNETVNELLKNGYKEGDVAILFKKKDCIPQHFSLSNKTATENSSDSLVVSTVLKYSGLERPVVILVDVIDRIPKGRKRIPFNYSAVTRAMVKLVIIRCKD